jgi:hypothetical protein
VPGSGLQTICFKTRLAQNRSLWVGESGPRQVCCVRLRNITAGAPSFALFCEGWVPRIFNEMCLLGSKACS